MSTWKRDFFTLSAGQIFSLLSSAVVQFAIIWWITDKTGSAVVLSIAAIVGFLPQALVGPFVGALVDRWNRKVVMIAADLGIAVASLVLALLFMTGTVQVWHIYLVLGMRSVGSAFHWPAMQASVSLIVPAEQLTRAAGFSQGLHAASNIIGPALGALVTVVWPMWGVLLLDVVGAILAGLMLLLVNIPQPKAVGTLMHGEGLLKEVAFGYHALTKARGLLVLSLSAAICIFIYMPVGTLFPLFVSRHFAGGVWHVGVVEIAFGSGMLLGSVILGIWGGTKKKVYTINAAYVAMGLSLLLMGLLPVEGFIWFVALSTMLGFTVPMFNGPFTAILQAHIEPGVQGRVFSFVNSMMLIATPLGLLIAGPAAERFGVPIWFLFSGIFISILGLICFFVPTIMNLEEKQKAEMEKQKLTLVR